MLCGADSSQYGSYVSIFGTYSNSSTGYYSAVSGANTCTGNFTSVFGTYSNLKYGNSISISDGNGTSTTNIGTRIFHGGSGADKNIAIDIGFLSTYSISSDVGVNFFVPSSYTSAKSSLYGQHIRIQGSVTTKYGSNVDISGIGSSTANYGYSATLSGAISSQYGVYLNVTGTSSTNYGLYINSSGATNNNYAIVTDRGDSIFNESGDDYDFRIEGMTQSNLFFVDASNDNIGMGTNTPDPKALLDMTSTTKGFLPPRMTTTQREAITSPPAGLLIFNTDNSKHEGYTGTTWSAFY